MKNFVMATLLAVGLVTHSFQLFANVTESEMTKQFQDGQSAYASGHPPSDEELRFGETWRCSRIGFSNMVEYDQGKDTSLHLGRELLKNRPVFLNEDRPQSGNHTYVAKDPKDLVQYAGPNHPGMPRLVWVFPRDNYGMWVMEGLGFGSLAIMSLRTDGKRLIVEYSFLQSDDYYKNFPERRTRDDKYPLSKWAKDARVTSYQICEITPQ